ncbi:chromosome partitioning protein ParB [Tunturiibacter empetritectus]|uniref:ParB family chromosome partitioning protein n=1 Tax=Tunturiibacter lichenicola TaxID=2051959 RepID=A0A852VBW2_9BACT|nr:chromosome partitioning protein ParB [Edaphobacter lichenicola]NYF87954.1 ParB family chromosome partitioning protein [Edaphobacter lichenicola]
MDSQRLDVHPYEEARGFQRLLDMPGYDVAALVLKSNKSASHIYARLSLLQLIPDVAQAFVEERITASHANLIARLPQEHQAAAFEQCWRKDWNDKEPHLLPAKHVTAWIETNLYLALADAPFDLEDIGLNPAAGACATCPRRSGFNTSLFADVQGDQCLDGLCYQSKVAAYIDRELATRPQLVQIETTWRPAKEQRPGILPKHSYRELDTPDNPDAEPPCPNTKSALIVFGRHAGKTITVCTDDHCPVHDPATVARLAKQEADNPAPVMEPATEEETEEEAEQREAEYEQRRTEHEVEQQRRDEERKTEYERQQKEYEAEQKRREKLSKARTATFERILDKAPAMFTAAQLRIFLRLLVHIDPYSFLEEVASHFAGNDENAQQTDEEIVLAALDNTADEKLTGFALRLALTDHVGIPMENEPDPLSEAEAAFAPPQLKASKPKKTSKSEETPMTVKAPPKKSAVKKQKVA